jgi:hypothetical protein
VLVSSSPYTHNALNHKCVSEHLNLVRSIQIQQRTSSSSTDITALTSNLGKLVPLVRHPAFSLHCPIETSLRIVFGTRLHSNSGPNLQRAFQYFVRQLRFQCSETEVWITVPWKNTCTSFRIPNDICIGYLSWFVGLLRVVSAVKIM